MDVTQGRQPIEESKEVDFQDALVLARKKEVDTRKRYFVLKCVDGKYKITGQMPYLGEWFDSDGIRHG